MSDRSVLLSAGIVLLGITLLVATIGHDTMLEACVCVVNALSRALLCMGLSILTGLVALVVRPAEGRPAARILIGTQAATMALAIFFLIHHAYLYLEVVS